MNDKCAAGTGRGMEVFADLLGVSINEVGPTFAASDGGTSAGEQHLRGLRQIRGCRACCGKAGPRKRSSPPTASAMAHRVVSLLERIGVEPDFAITGGIAKNIGVVSRLEKELGIKALKPNYDTQIAGALGAALFAKAPGRKNNK